MRRGVAFEALRLGVGLAPMQIVAAPETLLCEIARMGGSIAAEEYAERLRTADQLTLDEFAGDLGSVLKLAPPKSKKLPMRFPIIGEPGAKKILLFSGVLLVPALESNGVRVLPRPGIGEERQSDAAAYRSIREATLEQLP